LSQLPQRGRVLAEMAEQHRAAASGGFDQRGQRVDRALSPSGWRASGFLQPLARAMRNRRATQNRCAIGRVAVAPGAAGFLVIGLDRLGDSGMRDEADVGLVDPHAEGDRRHHHHVLARDEFGLVRRRGRRAPARHGIARAPPGRAISASASFSPGARVVA
jgi:hypothetical protein